MIPIASFQAAGMIPLVHDKLNIYKIACFKLSPPYGLSANACDFLNSYLSNRKQRVKVGQFCSSWLNIIKGIPQGSILRPFLFNILMNDIFYFKKKASIWDDMRMTILSHTVIKT